MSSPRGFELRYASARRLDADHAAYLAHGGVVLDIQALDAPPISSEVTVKLVAPGDREFVLSGRAGRFQPGRGLSVNFDEGGEAQAELDAYVVSADFRGLRNAEPPGVDQAPEVICAPRPEEADLTDPGFVPRPELTPSRTRRRRPVPAASPSPIPAATTNAPVRARRPRPMPEPALGAATPSTDMEASEDTEAGPAPVSPLDPAPPAAPDALPHVDPDPTSDDAATSEVSAEAPAAPAGPIEVRAPEPGEEFFVFVARFPTVTSFVEIAEPFDNKAELTLPFDNDGLTRVGSVAQLRLTFPGRNVFEMWGAVVAIDAASVTVRVSRDDEQFRKAILHPTTVAARKRLEREATEAPEPLSVLRIRQEKPKEDIERLPIRRRLARMGMDDKINLALSGGREERMAIAMDGNKAVHHYLLKNAKITLDEIAFMARLPSLNPDVLDKIAENPAYTQNPSITKALVYNPRTPVKTAIRLLDRLPRSEVMNLSKRSSMNQRLVMAAKKKIERRGR